MQLPHRFRRFTSAAIIAASAAGCGGGADVIAPPATAGSLSITSATSGSSSDPDGYVVFIDGTDRGVLGANAGVTVGQLVPGSHVIGLGGVAANCQIEGENLRPVTVTAGEQASAAYTIVCAAPPPESGSIRITTVTSGPGTDPDGYAFAVDGGASQPIALNGTTIHTNVAAGSHSVLLAGVAGDCTVQGTNPRSVAVTSGAIADLSFEISCGATTGSIQVTTVTTGMPLDPDGYTVSVDGGASQTIDPNATLTLGDLALGTHALTLSNVASNCHLDGENPRVIEVLGGSMTVTFHLNCLGANALIAFTSNAFQLLAILVVNPDGSGIKNLTPEDALESNPKWSPDGRAILFSRNDDLYVMNADGSGRVNLADGSGVIAEHRWSPDGRMIAYVDSREEGLDVVDDLWTMEADGTGKVKVAEQVLGLSWSGDGRIVYASVADLGDVHLRIINADGSGDVRLTDRAAFQPAWSPDGGKIAFVTLGDNNMYLIDPDGSDEVNLTQGLSADDGPTWSPDGSRIAFSTAPLGQPLESEVAVMNRDGSGRTGLTDRPGFDNQPVWSPDGTKIVFTRSENNDSEIYVMNADGGNQTNVSNRPGTLETAPDWNGQGAVTVASRQQAFYRKWLRANQLKANRLHR
jgi:Tol biopolymer transport system component